MKKLSILILAVVALAGCNEKDPVQTVEWYKENAPERATMIAKCKANPGELAASQNCMNATTAANHISLDKRGYKQRAPMNFSGGN